MENYELDHRRLGRDLKLFHLQEDAAGSVFWHPRGFQLYHQIENYIRSKLKRNGYMEVKSPQLYDSSLWDKSGHLGKFSDNMFMLEDENRQFGLKPMNCPGHVQIFNADVVSYRQLPMRLAEFGCCHRREPSGALHGIMRLRQFVQDDAHIFCREDQIADEALAFIALLREVYRDFGFEDLVIGFSDRPVRRAGSNELWDKAEAALLDAMAKAGLDYVEQKGEGAFYGPKLEFALKDNKGRQWQCGTLQMDFVLPRSLGAKYADSDGVAKHPVMLHRAILGSLERFIGILLEHYEGKLPAWLAPQQAVILPISEAQVDYAKYLANLYGRHIRIGVDASGDPLKQRIKNASIMKIPYLIIVGQKEHDSEQVVLRQLDGSQESGDCFKIMEQLVKNCHMP